MKIDYTHIVSHQSSREGGRIKIAVLHTTEGSDHPAGDADLIGLGSLFDTEEASANYGVNVAGRIGLYVEDARKAWAVCYLNPVAINLEQIGFAAFTRSEWFARDLQLHAAAGWLQYCHEAHGVPLRHGYVAGGVVLRTGVVQHKDLGAQGCGHTDCGPGYPEGYVRTLARYFVAHRQSPTSRTTQRLRRKVNRIRKHFGLRPYG
jgi:hypothetical protein